MIQSNALMNCLHRKALPHLVLFVPDQAGDQEDVNKRPDAHGKEENKAHSQNSCHNSNKCQDEHGDRRPGLAEIKAMRAKHAQEDEQEISSDRRFRVILDALFDQYLLLGFESDIVSYETMPLACRKKLMFG